MRSLAMASFTFSLPILYPPDHVCCGVGMIYRPPRDRITIDFAAKLPLLRPGCPNPPSRGCYRTPFTDDLRSEEPDCPSSSLRTGKQPRPTRYLTGSRQSPSVNQPVTHARDLSSRAKTRDPVILFGIPPLAAGRALSNSYVRFLANLTLVSCRSIHIFS